MEDKYEIKFYKNGAEIEIDSIPNEHLNGVIQCCKEQVNQNDRLDRVWSNMAKTIKENHER